ncbi:MAG: bifunctional folylpolyglutamate synthase/dihydrofolate synthase [Rhodobacteraceae bacterium]|nr:bifunctional folylpolyglutamate synthase/dihydrofolate synthase [Paracoccaceae bacterium]
MAPDSEAETGTILARLGTLYPRSIDLALNRPKRLLAALGHPEERLPPVVHIAGTNGKGSTLAMIQAGLAAAGQSVHAYISPHLMQFNERITLAGQHITETSLVEVLLECERVNRGQAISLFEIATSAAMLAFSRTPADYLLLEVGLGGRLDATNVVSHPHLTVITPVAMDHERYLGPTLPRIAAEKAGILKPGVPCVVSRQSPAALDVIERTARRTGSPLLIQDRDWWISPVDGSLLYCDQETELTLPMPRLVGPHQIVNAGAAIASLRHMGFAEKALCAAVTQAHWPGRMQKLQHGPLVDAAPEGEVWLDGGHNPAAGQALASTLRSMPGRATGIVCGMLKSKDVRGFLKAIDGIADAFYGITIPNEAASLPASHVTRLASELGLLSSVSDSPIQAVRSIHAACPESRILICGSLYLAGQVLRFNG